MYVPFDINLCERAFYAACNYIFRHSCNVNEPKPSSHYYKLGATEVWITNFSRANDKRTFKVKARTKDNISTMVSCQSRGFTEIRLVAKMTVSEVITF